jgi:hypothetical protein
MKNLLLLSILLLVIASCGKDEITYDFIGDYKATKLNTICGTDNFDDNAMDFKFCYNDGTFDVCLSRTLKVKLDNTYTWTDILIKSTSAVRFGQPSIINGTYTTVGNTISLCPNDGSECAMMMIDELQTTLSLEHQSNECFITWNFEKQ